MGYHIKRGYLCDNQTFKRLHRELMKPILLDVLEDLFPDKNWIVHHKDDNKLNNDILNLFIMTNQEHTSLHKKKELGKQRGKYKGTWYTNKTRNPWTRVWTSGIKYNGKLKSLGYFEDPLSAEIVYNLVFEELYGDDIYG